MNRGKTHRPMVRNSEVGGAEIEEMLMKARALLLGIGLALVGAPAFAQINLGEKAPKIEADAWYNLPKGMKAVSASDIKGQIIVAEFWQTTCMSCQRSIPSLTATQKKFQAKGVIFLALTDEGESKVAPYIEKNKVSFIVGAGAKRAVRDFAIKDCHTAFIIDADGKLYWTGHPAVIETELTKLIMDKPPKNKGFLAGAAAGDVYKKAEKLDKERKYVEAMEEYEALAKEYKGTKEAEKAAARLKEMKGNSKIMEIVRQAKADKEANGWLEVARVCVQYGDKEDAVKYYDRIIKKYAETNAGRYAREEIAPLKKKSKVADDEDDDNKADKAKDKKDKVKAKKDKDEDEDKAKKSEEEEEEEEDSGKAKDKDKGADEEEEEEEE
jgi:thiol-disulfide isomerase/thioredoxin